jgi:hypothetical protein
MKKLISIALLASSASVGTVSAATDKSPVAPPAVDPLVAMYMWWNEAIATPGALTPEAFGRYFTDDGEIVINGKVFAKGLPALVEHFKVIQAAGGHTETVLPFRHEFRSGNDIYSYQVIKSVRDGSTACLLAAGHAEVRNGKLAVVNLVRSPVDAASTPECAH